MEIKSEGKLYRRSTTVLSPFYSILGDEARDIGSVEQMPIVLRFVDSNKEINYMYNERFIKYVPGMRHIDRSWHTAGNLPWSRL